MCFVTKAPPINSIDSKCHTEKLKGSKTCLIGYSDFIVFNSPGDGQKQFQETRCAFGLKSSHYSTQGQVTIKCRAFNQVHTTSYINMVEIWYTILKVIEKPFISCTISARAFSEVRTYV